MASEGVDIYDVPGDHNTMLAAPNINILAEKLRRCLYAEALLEYASTVCPH